MERSQSNKRERISFNLQTCRSLKDSIILIDDDGEIQEQILDVCWGRLGNGNPALQSDPTPVIPNFDNGWRQRHTPATYLVASHVDLVDNWCFSTLYLQLKPWKLYTENVINLAVSIFLSLRNQDALAFSIIY